MKILAVDVGTGTQDILLFDSRVDLENSFKMVQPSPTMITHRRLKEATRKGQDVVLTGVTMGGGPSHWAAEDHLKAGNTLYATPDAARSFNDDLDVVREFGITLVSEDEVGSLSDDVRRLELRDFDFDQIAKAFSQFDVSLQDIDAVAVAVFDHGAAPPGYSDRQFRFDYIQERVKQNRMLSTFAFMSDSVPDIMTRMKSVVCSAGKVDSNLILMDTAPAAVLGALQDSKIRTKDQLVVLNVGNFHTISFRWGQEGIEGVFEHHTGFLDAEKLDELIIRLADGSLTHEEVFMDHGHGALLLESSQFKQSKEDLFLAVTGPRRAMMENSSLNPYFATPYGDMMLAGCYGLIKAAGDLLPDHKAEIDQALDQGREKPPWELP
ncbi:MAG: pyruvate formate lyase-activating protein [Aliifodinibius sp.]|nr:pyruvate formate lyase-activating protein [Fodinibius sp.]